MAESQTLVLFLACLCTLLLCVICLPELTRWSNRKNEATAKDQRHEAAAKVQSTEPGASVQNLFAYAPDRDVDFSSIASAIKAKDAAEVQGPVRKLKLKQSKARFCEASFLLQFVQLHTDNTFQCLINLLT
jgi:hypothetical protein